jgi:clan AA aspartic protease (TIGR02281 family)
MDLRTARFKRRQALRTPTFRTRAARTRRARSGAFCLYAALCAGLAPAAQADVYQWVSSSGSLVFTDDAGAFGRAATGSNAAARNPQPGAASLQVLSSERPKRPDVRVPFRHTSNLIQVTARLNSRLNASFLVDTGASEVVLPLALAEHLGFCAQCPHERATVDVTGVGVKLELPVMWLERISLGSAEVSRIRAIVDPHSQVALLGGEFLKHFVYTIDLDSGVLQLQPRAVRQSD